MGYQEGQVDYYGKKGLSLLGIMDMRCKIDREVSGFEYSFVDDLIKGYSGRDHVQVAAVIQLVVGKVQNRHPSAKKFIIQSDNASGFASQEIILFIFNMNTRLDDEKLLC